MLSCLLFVCYSPVFILLLLFCCFYLFFCYFIVRHLTILFILYIGVITSCSLSGFRNMGQLAACIIGARLGQNLDMFKTCGDENSLSKCFEVKDKCTWVVPQGTDVIAKFGDGACMPNNLVLDAELMKKGLTNFLLLVDNFPTYGDLMNCVKKSTGDGSCVSACDLCRLGVGEYPNRDRKAELSMLCLPTALHTKFCSEMQTAVSKVTLCAEEVERNENAARLAVQQEKKEANNKISETGCDAECANEPT